MGTTTLPAGPTAPRLVQAAYALSRPLHGLPKLRERYGDAFTVNVPIFGRSMVISSPAEVKQLFTAGHDVVDTIGDNLGRLLGPGSLFSLTGQEHDRQRKLLIPPFHGRRLAVYERMIEAETLREIESWPQDEDFPTLPSMMRITLNAILRAVFGAEGEEFDELRDLLPKLATLGSRLVYLPLPTHGFGRLNPWNRYWAHRRRYDDVVDRLIARARADGPANRDDVLALMLQSSYDDGSPMSRDTIADQLLTLLTAGHETTATTLAWAVERLRRHPSVLRRLVAELDRDEHTLLDATTIEVMRTRPVVDLTVRKTKVDGYRLGRWTLPKDYCVLISMGMLHQDEAVFPNALAFDPSRFVGSRPDLYEWISFGGGRRRCLGAAFASMEMSVVLRTLLREFTLLPTMAPDERWYSRGVAYAPGDGGIASVRRRTDRPDRTETTAGSTDATSTH